MLLKSVFTSELVLWIPYSPLFLHLCPLLGDSPFGVVGRIKSHPADAKLVLAKCLLIWSRIPAKDPIISMVRSLGSIRRGVLDGTFAWRSCA